MSPQAHNGSSVLMDTYPSFFLADSSSSSQLHLMSPYSSQCVSKAYICEALHFYGMSSNPSDTLWQGWWSSCRHGNSSYLSSYLSLIYASSSQVFCSFTAVIPSRVGRVRSLTRPVACTKQHHGVGSVLRPWSAVACCLLESVDSLPGSEHVDLHLETAA